MRKTLSAIIAAIGLLSLTYPVSAAWPWNVTKEVRNEVRQEVKNEVREELREELRNKFATIPAQVRNKIRNKIAFGSGILKAINGTTLTVEKDGKSYTVQTGTFSHCTTKFKRRFWGDSAIAEMTVGDTLNVAGRWQDEAKTIIEACMVRDVSIQKRFGVFVGEVKSLLSNGWVMTTVGSKRPDQTVTVTSTTKFVNRKEEGIAKGDIQVGHRIRVKGMWNNANNTVTEVTHVKDFSLPPKATGTPVPSEATETPTPTATPTP